MTHAHAGAAYDVGKIGVPDSVVNKPVRLDEAEFARSKEHPGKGAKILGGLKGIPGIVKGPQWRHERFDKDVVDGKTVLSG